MELKRREFLGWLLAAAAAALSSAWRAVRTARAAQPGEYPGPVVPLDDKKLHTQANWLG